MKISPLLRTRVVTISSPWTHPLTRSSSFLWDARLWTPQLLLAASLALCFWGFGYATPARAEGAASSAPTGLATLSLEDCKRVLAEGDEASRLKAVSALESMGQEAVPVLLTALDDSHDAVRARAIVAIGKLAPAHAEVAVSKLLELAQKDGAQVDEWPNWILAFKAIGKFGETALPTLDEQWKNASPEKKAVLCVAYSELGPAAGPAVPKLIELIEEDNLVNRRQAVGALMAIGPAAAPAVPVLRKALYHEDFHTQYWACRALGAIGEPALPAVPDLIDRLKNGAASVKRNAAAALGKIGPKIGPEAIQALIEAVDDVVQPVREQAVLALGRLGPDVAGSAREAIEKSHARRPIYPASAACWAIWRLGGPFEPLKNSLISDIRAGIYRDEATEIVLTMGRDAEPVIKELEALARSLAQKKLAPLEEEELANIQQTLAEVQTAWQSGTPAR
jgi:HEAT repeat protein